ncbi:MAG: NAD(P)-binding domain-containing protein, partial [Myxococcales bacterium]|nr:NAD(P)-binding domain-containing protein [Myxococcales bacterium]
MSSDAVFTGLVYVAPMLALCVLYLWRNEARTQKNLATLSRAQREGLTEPPSLHPQIDPNRCLGCATCVDACPEHDVLGLVHGKAQILVAANCVGHGACKDACPFDAISLVIGTERRGVEIPRLDAKFETNLPGLFVAGELGGMGLIRNAITQGSQVIESVCRRGGSSGRFDYDVIIVGAGPAGFAASLSARERGLRALTLEQEQLGGAVAHYPRRKLVLTAPVVLPSVGRIDLRETTKEALLALWMRVEADVGLGIHYRERVEHIERTGGGFRVTTQRAAYTARSVVLAIGRRGTPRKLEVPGEERSKVVYRLSDAAQYRGLHTLVVGGGDSAIEAACSLAEEPGTTVTLSYRGAAFSRAKPRNRELVSQAAAAGRLQVWLASQVREIAESSAHIEIA